ncbi:hypothetical protein [Erwinia sp. JUb26]|uniref:hypothetical protein n=1 Tax=Erwinia sp. JUb26 TaxID=2485126 RepID=UPI000F492400|nr:hypothetical protein [Erwinia sp. JUb26]ROR06800.1 hypothetical protein EC836_10781 [Erwinia sp. JUb26]
MPPRHRHANLRACLSLPPILLILACSLVPLNSQAEQVTVSLSQEQNGGEAGRACIYVYQGKAEYRQVKADENCPAEIVVDRDKR